LIFSSSSDQQRPKLGQLADIGAVWLQLRSCRQGLMLRAYRLMFWKNPILKVEWLDLRIFVFEVFTV